ncbi:MAG: EamA family transporter RarD [Eubacteriales bacterium]
MLKGNLLAISAYIFWGFMPLYWAMLGRVSPPEIIAHRIILSLAVLALFLLAFGQKGVLEKLKDKKTRRYVIAAALALGANWTAYIMAILAGRVLESSLAYYINPLVVILFGMIFLKEPAGKYKVIAIVLAAAGVLVLVFGYHLVPVYALTMALSFSVYGLIKKKIAIDPFVGLFSEMLVLLPIAVGVEIYMLVSGASIYYQGVPQGWFLVCLLASGIATMLPLILYSISLRSITLGNSGFLQFIAPTIMLYIGVVINGEAFTRVHLIAFILIWLAVAFYCVYLVSSVKKEKRA